MKIYACIEKSNCNYVKIVRYVAHYANKTTVDAGFLHRETHKTEIIYVIINREMLSLY
jgi:hypothetical protein